MEIIMKKALIIVSAVSLVIISVLVYIILFGSSSDKKGDKMSGVLLESGTDKPSGYAFQILSKQNITDAKLNAWIEEKMTSDNKEAYYSLHNDASSGLDMYIFMPNASEKMGDIADSDIKVNVKDQVLQVYVDSAKKHTKKSEDLILHIYLIGDPTDTTAKSERLYINGSGVPCVGTSFMTLAK